MGGVEDLLAYQKELRKEEGFLINVLEKIDEQVHALQVEQLHLLNCINSSMHTTMTTTDVTPVTKPRETSDKDLDLTIPFCIQVSEEEEDEKSNDEMYSNK